MVDAAVAIEALAGSAAQSTNMTHPEWSSPTPYATRLWATEWHSLFPTGDGRNTLTWRDRLSPNLPTDNIYNFYSSGEEVLREHVGTPPDSLWQTIADEVHWILAQDPLGVYVWALQEKTKGRAQLNFVLGSTHGGWKFNDWSYGTNSIYSPSTWWHMSPATAALLPDSQLQTNAFFDLSTSPSDNADLALEGANGSDYAQTNRNRLLSDTFPALTLPVGANPVSVLDQPADPHNFDMSSPDYQNGWPVLRSVGNEAFRWHHSDFREVAYTFTYPLFNKFVTLGELR
jgi:hypothetical protein